MAAARSLVFLLCWASCSATLQPETTLTCDTTAFLHRLQCDDGVIKVHNVTLSNRESEDCVDGVRPTHLQAALCSTAPVLHAVQKKCDGLYRCAVNMFVCHAARPCRTRCVWMETSHTCEHTQIHHVCQKQTARLACGLRVIKVLMANYGRTSRRVCEYGATWRAERDCEGPGALRVMADRCDGKHRCSVRASNLWFSDPCPGTKKYLQYSYVCVDG